MGNRAVITFATDAQAPCIYLHWNGGRASVEAFLQAGRDLGLRHADTPEEKRATLDALANIIAPSFFGCDVGFTVYRELYGETDTDNGDNGVYLLNVDMTVRGRLFTENCSPRPYQEEVNLEKTAGIYEQVVSRAPIFNA